MQRHRSHCGWQAAQVAACLLFLAAGLHLVGAQTIAPEDLTNIQTVTGTAGVATERAVANFSEIAQREQMATPTLAQTRAIARPVALRANTAAPSIETATALPTGLNAAPTAMSPAPTDSFAALGDNSTVIPPDTMGAVGPNHLMVTLNSQVRIQNRTGGAISTVSLNSFWSSLGNPDVFDPKIIYDPFNSRWIFAASANPGTAASSVLIGVSQTSNPTGTWNLYKVDVDAGNALWADYTGLGFNKDWIVVRVNMFTVSSDAFSRANIYVFNKADLYAHGMGTFKLLQDNGGGFSQAPAITYDNSLATMYLVENWIGSGGQLRISKITGAVGSETLTTGVAFPSTLNTWADDPSGDGDLAPQLGSTQLINTGDARIINCVYRNGTLWVAHGIFLPVNSPTRSSIQWWQLSTSGAVQQRGRIDDLTGSNFYAYPSIAVNANSDVLIGYSRFSANQFVSANYSFRLATDTASALQSEVVLKAGEGVYFKTSGGTENRWGDYSSTVVDPVNDTDFWTIQEYAATPVGSPTTNGSGRWGTWWGHISSTPSLPDLSVASMTHSPAIPAPGNPVSFSVTVTNQSTGSAGTFKVGFYSNRATAPTIATVPDQTNTVVNLAGRSSTQLVFTVTAPSLGAYTAWAFVDVIVNQVAETNEGNNAGPSPSGHVWSLNQPPTIDAGPDQLISLPTVTVNLNGTASDDGFPNGTLTTTWSKLSGPGTVTFGNANSLTTMATFSAAGAYTLRLVANDGAAPAIDQMIVIVNASPVVNAGPNQTITLPSSAILSGSASDDGVPAATLSTTWSALSGSGIVTFGDVNATNTTASFSLGGSYTLRLTASDGAGSSTDDVVIIANTAPTVDAGSDQSIGPSNMVVTLTGAVNDDGLPSGTLNLNWVKVSGPGSVVFANGSATNSTALFSVDGTYVLRLTASDGIASASDDVSITAAGGVSDASLYVTKAAMSINWSSHGLGINTDSFSIAGSFNPAGIHSSLAGSTVKVSVNETVVASNVVLTATGTFASPAGSVPSFIYRMSPVTGAFTFSHSGLDLRSILNLSNTTETVTNIVSVAVEVAGAGLISPVAIAQMELPFVSKLNSKSAAKFAFKKNRLPSGVFRSLKTAATQTIAGGHTVTAQGPLVGIGAVPVIPTGNVTIRVGGATIVVPFASLVRSGVSDSASLWTFSPALGGVAGLSKFSFGNATRGFTLVTTDLAETGIPLAGVAAPLSFNLPIEIEVPTAEGTVKFQTTVELKRTSSTATQWKR